MRLLDNYEGSVEATDLAFNILISFLLIILIILTIINTTKEDKIADVDSPGSIVVRAIWPNGSMADIDLWVSSPYGRSIGYSNKSGKIFNLLRDDLGSHNDATQINEEFTFSRGLIAGEYIVNVAYFAQHGETKPQNVRVVVELLKGSKRTLIINKEVILGSSGQEKTVIRFSLSKNGNLLEDTKNDIYKGLWYSRSNRGFSG